LTRTGTPTLALRPIAVFPFLSAGPYVPRSEGERDGAAIDTNQARATGASLTGAISTAIVAVMREYVGRGPTKARTTIRDNVVVVLLEDTLTRGEAVLVRNDRAAKVLDIRAEFQLAMREECIRRVEELSGTKVTAMMSANHIDPDLAAEIFVLDRAPEADGNPSTHEH
jgi:uncharacterized protein YbcI